MPMTLHLLRQVGQVYVLLSMFVNKLHLTMTLLSMVPKVNYCFLMFLLVTFILMDTMLKFRTVQCTLVIQYLQVTEQKL